VVATFGWWEIISPTPAAVQALCLRLASVRAQVCIVMGLPATAVSEAADGRFGYAWVGEPHSDTGGVGIIVATPWLNEIVRLQAQGDVCRRVLFCRLPGSVLGVGVYGPCVGTLPLVEYKAWLRQLLDVIAATASHYSLSDIWIFRDLNLRGVAPGPSAKPSRSQHQELAVYSTDLLRGASMCVLESISTHDRGGARDGGAIDIHITNF
jgi:hypothetical protein